MDKSEAADREFAQKYDVIICGGGLAGLALARQLSLYSPELAVLVLERMRRPLPESTLKVGESTIESGAYYYAQILQLEDYIEAHHLEKLGLRYFYGGGHLPLEERPEFGVDRFLPAKSYQLDRGLLEDHLRQLADAAPNVDLCEGVSVQDIVIDPSAPHHEVIVRQGERSWRARGRWVVDALGRRRLLQKKFGLGAEQAGTFSSAWFRVRGKLDVASLAPESAVEWRQRVRESRWNSTNHLMGQGYWVWLIPLSPGNTSVGIVASEEFHPLSQFNSYDKALAWLERHEPLVAREVSAYELMDFKRLRDYSYTSKQLFSLDRWCCVGEAAAFADPYYSVGSNMIGFANGLACRLVHLEREGRLEEAFVDHANQLFLAINDALTDTIHRGYPFHHNGQVMAMKTIWDYYIGWTTTDPQFYQDVYLEPKQARTMSSLIARIVVAQAKMMRLFEDWAARRPEPTYTFDFIDYIQDLPTLRRLFVRNLPPRRERFREVLANLRESIGHIEELAHVIFFFAVRDVLPEQAERLAEHPWIEITAIGLDPDRWQADGLFEPQTPARDLGLLSGEIGALFRPVEAPLSAV